MAELAQERSTQPAPEREKRPEGLNVERFVQGMDASMQRYLDPEQSPFLEGVEEFPDLAEEAADVKADWDAFVEEQGSEFHTLMEQVSPEDVDLIEAAVTDLRETVIVNQAYVDQFEDLEELPIDAIEAWGGTAEEFIQNTLEKNLAQPDFNIADLNELIEHAKTDPELLPYIKAALETSIGSVAETLLEDEAYRNELAQTKEALSAVLGQQEGKPESGAPLRESTSLPELMNIHEILGTNPAVIAEAFNITGLRPELGWKIQEKPIITEAEDAKIVMELTFETPEGEECIIERIISRELNLQTEEEELIATHERFIIPKSAQGEGIAKDVLRESLKAFDQIGVDAVALKANIDVGGYAWARYGFGWDLDAAMIDAPNPEKYISMQITAMQKKAFETIKYLGIESQPEAQALMASYAELLQDPTNVTPQDLMELGKDIPIIVGPNGAVYSEFDVDAPENARVMHMGKYSMLGSNWWGRLDIKPNPDGSTTEQRKLFESYLG